MNNPIKAAFFGECMLELNGTAFGSLQQSYGGDTFNTAVYLVRCGGGVIRPWFATALGYDTPARVKVLVASFMQPTAEYGFRPNALV